MCTAFAGDAPIGIEFDFQSDDELPAISFQRSPRPPSAANSASDPRISRRPTPRPRPRPRPGSRPMSRVRSPHREGAGASHESGSRETRPAAGRKKRQRRRNSVYNVVRRLEMEC